jgi:hypothetical protein
MAATRRPVDDTPICDPGYLQQVDPVWTRGRVPPNFWQQRTHRRHYLLWLAGKLGLRRMVDLYRLQLQRDCIPNHGSRVCQIWHGLALTAVRDCFPGYDWKPWLFPQLPEGFWDSAENRRSYLDWLGTELGFRSPEAWYRINTTDLRDHGGRGLLSRGVSFHGLLREYLPELDWEKLGRHRPLQVEDILAWADAYYARQATWPSLRSGMIPESGETWQRIDAGLRGGLRGLPGGTTLARLLEEHRGVLVGKRPPLSEEQILAWADAYFAEKGKWPQAHSGRISGTRESWSAVHTALVRGLRGLPGGASLTQLLVQRRSKRHNRRLPPLTEEQILAWADAYFAEAGKWPRLDSGPVAGADESWRNVNAALRGGYRGLRGRSSLALLLAERRGVEHPLLLPALTEEQILVWADAFSAKTGEWPRSDSGPIPGTRETWCGIAKALHAGGRGLRRRVTLRRLLAERRGARNRLGLPPLTEKLILAWADAYHAARGKWPTRGSGPIPNTGETWGGVEAALRQGGRGLKGSRSLPQLLAQRRGARDPQRPPLSEGKIIAWAHRFFLTEARWPRRKSGKIPQSPGDTWMSVDAALSQGYRGLPGGSSLARLLRERGLTWRF